MTIIKWHGPGWYAEGVFGDRYVSYFIGAFVWDDPVELAKYTWRRGLGTPKWVETPAGYDIVEETNHA